MKLSDEQINAAINSLTSLHQQVQNMRGLFRLKVGEQDYNLPVGCYNWKVIPGSGGVEMCSLPAEALPENADTECDYFATRGQQGAHQQRITIPQAVRLEVLSGELLFWKASAPYYATYQRGDLFTLQPGELHAFVAKTDFITRICFQPRFTSAI